MNALEAKETIQCMYKGNPTNTQIDALKIAYEALNMQIPKKPEKSNMEAICQECAHKLKRCYDFCPGCGQAIDWD